MRYNNKIKIKKYNPLSVRSTLPQNNAMSRRSVQPGGHRCRSVRTLDAARRRLHGDPCEVSSHRRTPCFWRLSPKQTGTGTRWFPHGELYSVCIPLVNDDVILCTTVVFQCTLIKSSLRSLWATRNGGMAPWATRRSVFRGRPRG